MKIKDKEFLKSKKLSKELCKILYFSQIQFMEFYDKELAYTATFLTVIHNSSIKFLEDNLIKIVKFMINDNKSPLNILEETKEALIKRIDNMISQCKDKE